MLGAALEKTLITVGSAMSWSTRVSLYFGFEVAEPGEGGAAVVGLSGEKAVISTMHLTVQMVENVWFIRVLVSGI